MPTLLVALLVSAPTFAYEYVEIGPAGVDSIAWSLNEAGHFVGEVRVGGEWHAFVHDGAVRDLHAGLPAEARESRAHEIADNGCVVGSWTGPGGDLHAWRLCPEEEEVLLRVTPRSLNLHGGGRWLTGRLRLDPDEVDEAELVTCRLGDLPLAAPQAPETASWGRGSRQLVVKIDRQAIAELVREHDLAPDGELRIEVCGTRVDGKGFRGRDVIGVHDSANERTRRRARR